MKTTLCLEAIGDDQTHYMRLWRNVVDHVIPGLGSAVTGSIPQPCWVAEITGTDHKYKYKRKFLHGKKDYQKSNSKGSRGVYIWYILESGKHYEVKERVSWSRSKRYFIKVTDAGDIVWSTELEVESWLKNRSE